MRGALSWRMIVVGVLCALGIAALASELMALLPYLLEEERERAARPGPPGGIRLSHSFVCPGLLGWMGAWGYLASWIWLPLAVRQDFRAVRSGGRLRAIDRLLPLLVALEIVALQCLLRLTPLQSEGYPLL